jgi:hypothetical protein
MTVTLPYGFNTSRIVEGVLKSAVALVVVVVVPGVLYSLFVSHSTAAAIQLLLIGALVIYFGTLVFRNLPGSRGAITATRIDVQPGRLFGLWMAGPKGTFAPEQFRVVRVERIFGPIGALARWHERVWLLGRAGTPDILIARTERDAGTLIGHALATLLGLPYEDVAVPH